MMVFACNPRRFLLRCVALLLCAALLLSAVSCADTQKATGLTLDYRIAKGAGRHTLRVWLTVDNTTAGETLQLYLSGNDFEVKTVTDANQKPCVYTREEDYLTVTMPQGKMTVYYTVSVGDFGKHGRAGIANDDMWAASGEQLLLMPLAAYSVDENEIAKAVSSVSVQVEAAEGQQISAPTGRWDTATWSVLYQLRQSAFAVGKFRQETHKIANTTVHIDYAVEQQASALQKVRAMLDYYADVFGQVPNGLRICLLDTANGGEYVMGGAGGFTLAATFLPDENRDWELLAHRLFHAFFETKYPNYAAQMPENLWFYEGLASCYEWLASTYALTGRADAADGVAKLYTQYLYLFAKYPAMRVRAADEAAITEQSAAKTEFLHYYIAPLLVYPLLSAETKAGETIEQFAAWLKTATFEKDTVVFDGLAATAAGNAVLKQAQSAERIPVPAGLANTVSDAELVPLLARAEEHIVSWLRLEDTAFTYEPIDAAWLDMAMKVAEQRKTPCTDDAALSQAVRDFSPEMYRILAAETLRQEIVSGFEQDGVATSAKWYRWLQQQQK